MDNIPALMALPETELFFKSKYSVYLFYNLLRKNLQDTGITIRFFTYKGNTEPMYKYIDLYEFKIKNFDAHIQRMHYTQRPLLAAVPDDEDLFLLQKGRLSQYVRITPTSFYLPSNDREVGEMILSYFGQEQNGRQRALDDWSFSDRGLNIGSRPDRILKQSEEIRNIVIPKISATLRYCIDLFMFARDYHHTKYPNDTKLPVNGFPADRLRRRQFKTDDSRYYIIDLLVARADILKDVTAAAIWTRDRRAAEEMTESEYRKQQALDIVFRENLKDLKKVGIDTGNILQISDEQGRTEAARAARMCVIS